MHRQDPAGPGGAARGRRLTALALPASLRLRPEERLDVALLFLYGLAAVGGAVVIGRSVGRALFLSELPPDLVPLKIVLSALGVLAATAVYAACGRWIGLSRLIVGSQLLLIAGVLAFWAALGSGAVGGLLVLAALFTWLEIAASLVNLQFWVIAGQIFDPRRARRAFGLIAAGGTLGNVVAGAALGALGRVLAPVHLLLVLAGCLGICTACAAILTRRHRVEMADAPPVAPRQAAGQPVALAEVARSRLVAAIVGIILLMTVISNVTDYQLDRALQLRFGGDAQAMSAFLGDFYLVLGAVAFVVQIVLLGSLLERFGLRATLSVPPAVVGAASLAVLATGAALPAVALARGADMALRFTLADTSLNLLYLPIEAGLRRRAKQLVEGAFKPVAGVVLALGLAAARASGLVDLAGLSVLTIVLAAGWIALAGAAFARYRHALADGLRGRRLQLDATAIDLSDPATRGTLLGALHGDDPALALSALGVVAASGDPDWADDVAGLLGSPVAELRIAALDYLGGTAPDGPPPAVARLLAAPEAEVRGAAVRALAAAASVVGRSAELDRLIPLLDDPAAGPREEALVALLSTPGRVAAPALAAARTRLVALAGSDEPAERTGAAEALGRLSGSELTPLLDQLLRDERGAVQVAAVRAAGAAGRADLVPALLERLGRPGAVARAAAEALARLGGAVVPMLGGALDDPATAPGVRVRVPGALARIGSPAAAAALVRHLADGDPAVRGAVYEALGELPAGAVAPPAPLLREQLAHEAGEARHLAALWAELGADGRDELLAEAIERRLDATRARIVALLDLLHPGELPPALRRGLAARGRERASALDLLDSLLDVHHRGAVMSVFEASTVELAALAHAHGGTPVRPTAERLAELAGGPDRWLRVCAIARIGALGLASLGGVVAAASDDPDELVRETAARARAALGAAAAP